MNPLVTIITPTYNRGNYLRETIDSVLAQDYAPFEYIVIDDGSTDDTLLVLAEYGDRISAYSHQNIGENPTVNRGFELAQGEFICVVNSDDPLLPGAVRETVEALQNDPAAVVAYPDWHVIGPQSEVVATQRLREYDVSNMLRSFNYGLGPGAMIRRSAILDAGARDTQFRYAGDAEMWLRLALIGRLHHIPKVLATHRVHPDSLSVSDRGPKITVELKRMVDKTYRHPDLPPDLRRDRYVVYSGMHRGLAQWCEAFRFARWRHQLIALAYTAMAVARDPRLLARPLAAWRQRVWNWARRLLQWPRRVVRGLVLSGLRLSMSFSVGMASAKRVLPSRQIARAVARVPRRFGHALTELPHRVSTWMRNSLHSFRRLAQGSVLSSLRTTGLFTAIDEGEQPLPTRKFAIVSYYLPPSWSGGAVVLGRILAGVDPVDYCLISRSAYPGDTDGHFIHRLPVPYVHAPGEMYFPPNWSLLERVRAGWRILVRARQLARAFTRASVRKVVVTTGDLIELPAALVAARIVGADFYVYLFDDFISQWWAHEAAGAMARTLEPIVLRRAAGIIAPCAAMVSEIQTRYSLTPHLVPNPCAKESLAARHDPLRADTRKPVEIVFTGAVYHVNLDAMKLLLEAMSLLEDIDVRLVLYTAQQNALSDHGLISDKVIVRDHVSPAAVAMIQAQADILLLPFTFDPRAETLVRTSATAKLADYLAAGRPILALGPGYSFVAQYLEAHDCGYVAKCNSASALAEVIAEIVRDRDKRIRVCGNAVARARADFSIDDSRRAFLAALGVAETSAHADALDEARPAFLTELAAPKHSAR